MDYYEFKKGKLEKDEPKDEVLIGGINYTKLDPCMSYVSKSFCKISFQNRIGSGFLIKLYKADQDFFCLMTCEHVVTREMINQKSKIRFLYDSIGAKLREIELDKKKRLIKDFRFLNNIDTTVIEIIPSDKISSEFFLSPNLDYMYNFNDLKNKDISILQYPKGELAQAYRRIKNINKNKYEFSHTASTEQGSSGSPIFLKDTIEVIGIHKSGFSNNSENYGNFIGPIFDFFINFYDNKKVLSNNIYDRNKISKRNQNNRNNVYPIENKNDININKKYNNKLNIMTLFYEINEYPVKIFGYQFVEHNKNNCYLLINDEVKELCTQLNKNEINLENNMLKIKLIEINTITDMSSMFDCGFCEFNSLISLPDISKWNTTNVTSFWSMFNGCSSLISLPDISKWNTTNVINFCCMFNRCSSLISLPDISKWNTTNVEDMSYMFSDCRSLESLPEISRWNTKNVKEMRKMFSGCESLVSLPDISKWNTTNVTSMENMFNRCSSLVSLPDISKWNTINVDNMSFMFSKCSSLKSLPDISGWNIMNVYDMSYMFYYCTSLISFPDISNWKINKELKKNKIFEGCDERIIPAKLKDSNCLVY